MLVSFNLFSSEDETKAILSILVGSNYREYKLIWAMTNKGNFTMKSAYFVDLNLKGRGKGLRRTLNSRKEVEGHMGFIVSSKS